MTFKFCPDCGAALDAVADLHQPQTCAACGHAHYRNSKPCAGALVVRDGRVLLARRARPPAQGQWDIPGGFLHADENPEDGARREILEETGLRVRLTGLLGVYMDRYGEDSDLWLMNLYYLAEPLDDAEPRAADDVSEVRWFAPDELPRELAFPHECKVLADWRARLRLSQ
jgi:8-oxo-dGTP diphosphatase